MPSKRRAYFAWAVVCVVWGTTYLAIRIALGSIPPLVMAGIRYSVAGLVLVGALAARGEPLPPPAEWPPLVVLGVLLLGFGNGGVVWAEQYIPSGLTAVLIGTAPFWMVGVDALFQDGGVLTVRRVAGLAIGFLGVVVLVWPEVGVGPGGRAVLIGVLSTQIACLGWAIGSSYARSHAPHRNVLMTAAFEMTFGGLALLAAASADREFGRVHLARAPTLALAYLIVFGATIAFSAYAYALKHLPIATVSLYAYVNPIIAVLLGRVVLGEPLTARLVVAGAVVLTGMALVRVE